LRALLAPTEGLPFGVRAELESAGLAFAGIRTALEIDDTATAARLVTRAFGALSSAARIAAGEARRADEQARRRRRRRR
jgi:hypothetical protein